MGERNGLGKGNKKRLLVLIMIGASLFVTTGCGIKKASNVPKGVPASVIKPIEVIAEAKPTEPPAVVVRDAVKSRSPMKIFKDVPRDVQIPAYYSLVDLDNVPHAVYAYNLGNNETVFRVYGEVQELEDGNVVNTLTGFFTAKITIQNDGYHVETDKEEYPVVLEEETPATLKTCVVPTKQNITNYVNKAKADKAAYEKALAKAQKNGSELPKEPEWDGLPILTKDTPSVKIPSELRAVRKVANLYYYESKYRENEYRRYATPDGTTSGYYISNSKGELKDGSLEVDIKSDVTKERRRQNKAVTKPSDGIYRVPVKIYLSDGQLQVVDQIIIR